MSVRGQAPIFCFYERDKFFLFGRSAYSPARGRSRALLGDGADPKVSVTNGVVVVLEPQRKLFGRGLIRRTLHMRRRPHDLHVVLNQHAVLNNRDRSRSKELAGRIEARPVEHDVVRLPAAWRPAGVHERRGLAANTPPLALPPHAGLGKGEDLTFSEAAGAY